MESLEIYGRYDEYWKKTSLQREEACIYCHLLCSGCRTFALAVKNLSGPKIAT